MKTMIVLSDTHNRRHFFEKITHLFAENDYIVHLGDGSIDMRPYLSAYPDKTYVCKGNCDLYFGEEEYVIEVEKVRILCCHGHRYGVKSDLVRLAYRAKELDCSVALYGHTHLAESRTVGGVRCINPGCMGSFVHGSYCYLIVNGDQVTETIVQV